MLRPETCNSPVTFMILAKTEEKAYDVKAESF